MIPLDIEILSGNVWVSEREGIRDMHVMLYTITLYENDQILGTFLSEQAARDYITLHSYDSRMVRITAYEIHHICPVNVS